MRSVENPSLMESVFRPEDLSDNLVVAVSARGTAPPDTASPTAVLARRFADSLGYPELPLVRATQVHGARVIVVSEPPAPRDVVDAGECDALVTALSGVGLVVQTADCVPVILAASDAVAVVHAGWRGAAVGIGRGAAETFLALTGDLDSVRAWLGPAIGPCCYEVGAEVAGQFAPELSRRGVGGKFHLDLPSAVRFQLESAGIRPESITQPPGCTMCGGEHYASYRRDRERAGRMIALVARLR
jgi:purine-nucleoside/S-methyl-5'-thioadenosine phosphorylase / adenosine deaminase